MGHGLYKLAKEDDLPRKVGEENPYYRKFKKDKDELDGWDRLKLMFEVTEYGETSPEINRVKESTLIAFFVGGLIGGVGRSRIARHEWIRKNLHTAFETPMTARRQLQDKVMLGFGSGAWRIGWRLAAFTGIYMLSSTCISVYRGKLGILDQSSGAAIAGFLYKFRDGPKASIAGAVIGAFLGLVAGTISIGTLKILGIQTEDVLSWQYKRFEESNERKQLKIIEARVHNLTQSTPLLAYHEKLNKLPNNKGLDTIHEEFESESDNEESDENKENKESNKVMSKSAPKANGELKIHTNSTPSNNVIHATTNINNNNEIQLKT